MEKGNIKRYICSDTEIFNSNKKFLSHKHITDNVMKLKNKDYDQKDRKEF